MLHTRICTEQSHFTKLIVRKESVIYGVMLQGPYKTKCPPCDGHMCTHTCPGCLILNVLGCMCPGLIIMTTIIIVISSSNAICNSVLTCVANNSVKVTASYSHFTAYTRVSTRKSIECNTAHAQGYICLHEQFCSQLQKNC